MTDEEVLDQAGAEGFELLERTRGGQRLHDWARGDEEPSPCYLGGDKPSTGMADRPRRSRVFA
jgi:hypothetical protein